MVGTRGKRALQTNLGVCQEALLVESLINKIPSKHFGIMLFLLFFVVVVEEKVR